MWQAGQVFGFASAEDFWGFKLDQELSFFDNFRDDISDFASYYFLVILCVNDGWLIRLLLLSSVFRSFN
jgi:hypothetical protein